MPTAAKPIPQRPRAATQRSEFAVDWSRYGNKPPEGGEGLRPGLHVSPVVRYPQAVTYSCDEGYE